jgi:hypothetical protein
LNQEINFIPDFGAATNGIASTVTWELEGSNPLRCEGVEADPGQVEKSKTPRETIIPHRGPGSIQYPEKEYRINTQHPY